MLTLMQANKASESKGLSNLQLHKVYRRKKLIGIRNRSMIFLMVQCLMLARCYSSTLDIDIIAVFNERGEAGE